MAGSRLVAPRLRTEYAVVGGGLTGLSAAWALRRRGREVLVLEQASIGHLGGGSHGACRIFRLGYEDPDYVSLARQARTLWSELEAACGERLLHPTPQVTFGPMMAQVRAAMEQAGAASELLTAAEAASRFPGVRAGGQAILEPDSAVIAADRALAALASLTGLAGPTGDNSLTGAASPGERVTALADDGRRVVLSTGRRTVEARRAIICAGPWTAGLLATAGIALPAQATLEQVCYLRPARDTGQSGAAAMPIFVHYGGEFPYGLPVPGSVHYKIGLHHGGPPVDPDRPGQSADAGLVRRTEQAARDILPWHDPRPVTVERCVYDNSPDTDFVVDRIGNVVIGSGTSGHGFKFGPLLGEWLASLATDDSGGTKPPARFALRRFRLQSGYDEGCPGDLHQA